MKKSPTKYDLWQVEFRKLIKKNGILVETMSKETSYLHDFEKHKNCGYIKNLGMVPIKNVFGNITNVYSAYEDKDGTIKYYNYPQYSQKEIKRMRKRYERNNNLN